MSFNWIKWSLEHHSLKRFFKKKKKSYQNRKGNSKNNVHGILILVFIVYVVEGVFCMNRKTIQSGWR